jgi:DNA-binding response OmpR family regulator
VIDDDPYIVDVISTSLRVFGQFTVLTATDSIVGLALSAEAHPDAIVIDVGMPHLDGYQIVRALRGDPETEYLPIVILSARVQERDHLLGMMAGADFYLDKPLNPFQLVEAIRAAVALGQQQRESRVEALANWKRAQFGILNEDNA